ncbi:MAG TPA: YciC family protein [Candidatus Saccharimonadales bacterium]|nr:YciC family protein [Candidatus Saccharimonadales bacterium]
MSFSLFKNATKFAWNELYKHIDTWFMLCLKVFIMVLAIMIGTLFLGVAVAFLFGRFIVAFNILPSDIVLLMQSGLGILLAIFVFFMLVKLVNIAYIPTANALDVAQGKKMRNFKYKMTSGTLLLVNILMMLIIMVGLVLLIIPGIIFAVRFSFAPFIVLDEKYGAFQAMSRSWKLTENKFVQLCPIVVLAGIFQYIPIINLLNFFFPFTNLIMSFAYVSLKEE